MVLNLPLDLVCASHDEGLIEEEDVKVLDNTVQYDNEKNFKEMLQGKLKHLFIPANSMINNNRITKDSIKGYIKKPIDNDSDSDSDPE